MKSFLALLAAALFLTLSAQLVEARPTFGSTCSSCHASVTGKLSTVGGTLLNLDAKRLDKKKTGSLRTYTVKRGATLTLSITSTSPGAIAVTNLTKGGIVNKATNKLVYTADTTWTKTGTPVYYYKGITTKVTFKLTVKATTPLDYYEVTIRDAGKAGGLWTQAKKIYIKVVP